jgi:hypothetical protein
MLRGYDTKGRRPRQKKLWRQERHSSKADEDFVGMTNDEFPNDEGNPNDLNFEH